MSEQEVWITVAVTDRARALRAMVMDLLAQARDVAARPVFCLVENSRQAAQREANLALVRELQDQDVEVELLSGAPFGRCIAESRRRQRAWVEDIHSRGRRPTFIWMLDDDNRLDHLVWDGVLGVRRLEHHLETLMDWASRKDRPDVLIGQVSGDPPIPPAATLASRLTDLVANLKLLVAAHPDDRASAVVRSLRVAGQHDDYYDFSHERSVPSWHAPCRWLVRNSSETASQAVHTMLDEAWWLDSGIAITRPILARKEDLGTVQDGFRRGGNTVFFSAEACLAHLYPSHHLAGAWTRRGDMVGARLLAREHDVVVGAFSVRHCRHRERKALRRRQLERSIVSDNLGAALARGVAAERPQAAIHAFLEARVVAISEAMLQAETSGRELTRMLAGIPAWVEPSVVARLDAKVARILSQLPLENGRLATSVSMSLLSPAHHRVLARSSSELSSSSRKDVVVGVES